MKSPAAGDGVSRHCERSEADQDLWVSNLYKAPEITGLSNWINLQTIGSMKELKDEGRHKERETAIVSLLK